MYMIHHLVSLCMDASPNGSRVWEPHITFPHQYNIDLDLKDGKFDKKAFKNVTTLCR